MSEDSRTSPDIQVEPTFRLSVVIGHLAVPLAPPGAPVPSRRGLTERAIRSILEQPDPIGTEVVVVDDEVGDELAIYLKEVFPTEFGSGRLKVVVSERSGDPGKLRNRGTAASTGSFLAFVNEEDHWKPGRLARLEPLLKKHDLILATDEVPIETTDWIRAFVTSNWAVRSSGVIRRTLYEEVGGFPEGYAGLPLPKKVPGTSDYEFWLKCLLALLNSDRRERFLLIQNQHVVTETPELPAALSDIQGRVKQVQEVVSLLRVAPKLPKRHWLSVAKRIKETGKEVFRKRSR